MASDCFPWRFYIVYSHCSCVWVLHWTFQFRSISPRHDFANFLCCFFVVFSTSSMPMLLWAGPALIWVIPLDEVRRSDYTATRLERSNNTICSPQVSPTNGGSKVMGKWFDFLSRSPAAETLAVSSSRPPSASHSFCQAVGCLRFAKRLIYRPFSCLDSTHPLGPFSPPVLLH